MNTESIIGIVSGIFGIIGGIWLIIQLVMYLKAKCKIDTNELFAQLTNKELSDMQRKRLLRRLNKSSLIRGRIKEDYITNFALLNRGKESLLFEICDNNDIEPTDDNCKGLIGVSMLSLREKYLQKRRTTEEKLLAITSPAKSNTNVMSSVDVGDAKVYMSELLKTKYPKECDRLIHILDNHHIKYGFLKGTKDIWCRDYMPVQTKSGKLIQFKYDPSYLKGNKEWEESRSDVKQVCKLNKIDAIFSNINLDGGNVLLYEDRAIISDRIYAENPDWDKEKLVNELSLLLESEIIIIPAQKSDMTGHADGMVRFVNRNTILGNTLADEYKYWREGIEKVLDKYNLRYIDVPFFLPKDSKHPNSAVGIYVNYLEVGDLIVLPVFGRNEDQKAIDIISRTFPDRVIETIDYNGIAMEGGLLNCTTWVVQKES